MFSKKTFTYKVVGDCAIKADVYGASNNGLKPAIIFIHGGGLIVGNREDSPVIIELLVNAGYTVVSIDYRLAPETKLKNIIEDLHDAFSWAYERGQELFNIDQNRMGVVGTSSGGYLALMSGLIVNHTPKALVSIYGYGDLTRDWCQNPSPFYCQQSLVTESAALEAIGRPIISETSWPNKRISFYLYCRQHGLWSKEVTGYDYEVASEAFDPFCPIRQITPLYPPTLLLHGDKDTDVPYEESVLMAEKLKEAGVEHQLVKVLDKGHRFEVTGLSDPVVANAFNKVLAFLKHYV